jgi:hypothetical protein
VYEGDGRSWSDTGLCQELFGFRLVKLIGAHLAIAKEARGHRGVHGISGTKEHMSNNRLFIHGVIQGLPHFDTVERGLLGIHSNENGTIAGCHQDFDSFVALQGWQIGDRR